MQLKSKQAWVFRKTALELLLGVFSTHLHAENVRSPALRSDTESNKQIQVVSGVTRQPLRLRTQT